MLTQLRIQNYALIRELDVRFNPGFTIITGETGAGKSILLGALSLILGERADTAVLNDKSNKCVVEGVFKVEGYGMEEVFGINDLDYDNHAIFRREINPAGKSRAFINDSPVTLKVMEEMGRHLIDIHSQHQTLELGSRLFQLMVVDICADNNNLLDRYKEKFKEYKHITAELAEAEDKALKSKTDLDYYQFQFDQLQKAALTENEQEMLEKELEILTHAEEIKSGLINTRDILNGDNDSSLAKIKSTLGLISRIKAYLPDGEYFYSRIESIYVELKDIADEAESVSEKIEHDPARSYAINERLDLIYSLQQKHHVSDIGQLITLRNFFEAKIQAISSNEEEITRLKQLLTNKYSELCLLANKISDKRISVIPMIERKVSGLLLQLGLPKSKFRVEIIQDNAPGLNGIDSVSFLFSANKNVVPSEISKVASGGELSRVMLTIKTLLSKSKALPTIIFDEIDSGISGEIADKMGSILKEISRDMQVINITHLPQIAAKGDHHFLVYKEDDEHQTLTHLKLLSRKERVEELAKMLSGESITRAALMNAEDLLSN
jgi:DNA repair protein RecN (Recombination protein N)